MYCIGSKCLHLKAAIACKTHGVTGMYGRQQMQQRPAELERGSHKTPTSQKAMAPGNQKERQLKGQEKL